MRGVTVLISSAGRRSQLLDCFREDAVRLDLELRLLAADIEPRLSPACQQADAAFKVPRCTAAEFIPALLKICRQQRVILLIPTIDTELAVLSKHADDFAAIGTRVVVSAPALITLAGDKLATAAGLAAVGIPTPKSLLLRNYLRDPAQLRQRVIAKPKNGSASIGIVRPRLPEELEELNPDCYIVQELWEGREYTVNLFFNQSGVLRCAIPHWRIETRGGEVSKGRTERVPQLMEAAEKLVKVLPGARGPLCFQAIVKDSGEYAVFEINARFGGGYPLAHRAGARFSQWLLEEAMGLPSTANNDWKEGVTMLRYDSAVFIGE